VKPDVQHTLESRNMNDEKEAQGSCGAQLNKSLTSEGVESVGSIMGIALSPENRGRGV